MPKQLPMTHSPAEAETLVLVVVLLWEVFFSPYAAMKKTESEGDEGYQDMYTHQPWAAQHFKNLVIQGTYDNSNKQGLPPQANLWCLHRHWEFLHM